MGRFSRNTKIPNFMKIRPVGAELLHADRQTRRSEQSHFAILRTRLKWTTQNTTIQTQTLNSLTDFSLHIRSTSFKGSVDTIITNLHPFFSLFLSFSYSFLSVAGLMTALLPYMCSPTVGKNECLYAMSETYSSNVGGKKMVHLPFRHAFCGTSGHSSLTTKYRLLCLKTQSVPHSKHFSSRL